MLKYIPTISLDDIVTFGYDGIDDMIDMANSMLNQKHKISYRD